jgi:hypothetical protein
MDEVVELSGRSIETQFQVDRFSRQTLALAYQRLVAETASPESKNRSFPRDVSIDRPAFQVTEVVP